MFRIIFLNSETKAFQISDSVTEHHISV